MEEPDNVLQDKNTSLLTEENLKAAFQHLEEVVKEQQNQINDLMTLVQKNSQQDQVIQKLDSRVKQLENESQDKSQQENKQKQASEYQDSAQEDQSQNAESQIQTQNLEEKVIEFKKDCYDKIQKSQILNLKYIKTKMTKYKEENNQIFQNLNNQFQAFQDMTSWKDECINRIQLIESKLQDSEKIDRQEIVQERQESGENQSSQAQQSLNVKMENLQSQVQDIKSQQQSFFTKQGAVGLKQVLISMITNLKKEIYDKGMKKQQKDLDALKDNCQSQGSHNQLLDQEVIDQQIKQILQKIESDKSSLQSVVEELKQNFFTTQQAQLLEEQIQFQIQSLKQQCDKKQSYQEDIDIDIDQDPEQVQALIQSHLQTFKEQIQKEYFSKQGANGLKQILVNTISNLKKEVFDKLGKLQLLNQQRILQNPSNNEIQNVQQALQDFKAQIAEEFLSKKGAQGLKQVLIQMITNLNKQVQSENKKLQKQLSLNVTLTEFQKMDENYNQILESIQQQYQTKEEAQKQEQDIIQMIEQTQKQLQGTTLDSKASGESQIQSQPDLVLEGKLNELQQQISSQYMTKASLEEFESTQSQKIESIKKEILQKVQDLQSLQTTNMTSQNQEGSLSEAQNQEMLKKFSDEIQAQYLTKQGAQGLKQVLIQMITNLNKQVQKENAKFTKQLSQTLTSADLKKMDDNYKQLLESIQETYQSKEAAKQQEQIVLQAIEKVKNVIQIKKQEIDSTPQIDYQSILNLETKYNQLQEQITSQMATKESLQELQYSFNSIFSNFKKEVNSQIQQTLSESQDQQVSEQQLQESIQNLQNEIKAVYLTKQAAQGLKQVLISMITNLKKEVFKKISQLLLLQSKVYEKENTKVLQSPQFVSSQSDQKLMSQEIFKALQDEIVPLIDEYKKELESKVMSIEANVLQLEQIQDQKQKESTPSSINIAHLISQTTSVLHQNIITQMKQELELLEQKIGNKLQSDKDEMEASYVTQEQLKKINQKVKQEMKDKLQQIDQESSQKQQIMDQIKIIHQQVDQIKQELTQKIEQVQQSKYQPQQKGTNQEMIWQNEISQALKQIQSFKTIQSQLQQSIEEIKDQITLLQKNKAEFTKNIDLGSIYQDQQKLFSCLEDIQQQLTNYADLKETRQAFRYLNKQLKSIDEVIQENMLSSFQKNNKNFFAESQNQKEGMNFNALEEQKKKRYQVWQNIRESNQQPLPSFRKSQQTPQTLQNQRRPSYGQFIEMLKSDTSHLQAIKQSKRYPIRSNETSVEQSKLLKVKKNQQSELVRQTSLESKKTDQGFGDEFQSFDKKVISQKQFL